MRALLKTHYLVTSTHLEASGLFTFDTGDVISTCCIELGNTLRLRLRVALKRRFQNKHLIHGFIDTTKLMDIERIIISFFIILHKNICFVCMLRVAAEKNLILY